ncbi:hypothetical protein D3C72_1975910 [compost metagenome]
MEISKVFGVFFVAFSNELFWSDAAFASLHHNWRAMRVVCANKNAIIATHALEASPKVSLKIFYQMPNMDISIGIGQSSGHKNFTWLTHGKLLKNTIAVLLAPVDAA